MVDDGSTDHTKAAITPYLEEDKRIHYYYITNRERGAARNFGISKAKGDYLVFIDSDDLMLPNHLEVLCQGIHHKKFPDFIATRYNSFDGKQHHETDICRMPNGAYDYRILLKGNPFSCNFCVRRNLQDLTLFQEDRKYAAFEDWMFLMQNLIPHKMVLLDQVTICMNDHDARSMRSDYKKLVKKRLLASQFLIKDLKLDKEEENTLWFHTYYFNAIHAYMGGDRLNCYAYLAKAAKLQMKIDLILMAIKATLGQNLIQRLR